MAVTTDSVTKGSTVLSPPETQVSHGNIMSIMGKLCTYMYNYANMQISNVCKSER